MKTKNLLIMVLAVLLYNCSNRPEILPHEVMTGKVQGKVKTVTHYRYEAEEKFGQLSEGDMSSMDDEILPLFGEGNKRSTYNKDGSIKETVFFDDYGDTEAKVIYENEDNKALGYYMYDEDGELVGQMKYLYDEGKLSNLSIMIDEESMALPYKYNTKENKVNVNLLMYTMDFYYDKNSHLAKISIPMLSSNEYTIKYVEFDKSGNWTKSITYINENGVEKPIYISKQIIEYY